MPLPTGGQLTKAGAPVSGVSQVETATIIGTITGDGNASITVTAAGMAGSPLTVPVAVLNGDTASVVGGKVRTALAADPVVGAFFTISGSGANVVATANQSAANDATMNIASANGTCSGLTAAPTSANTTAGVKGDFRGAPTDQYVIDTTNNDIYQNTGSTKRPVWTAI